MKQARLFLCIMSIFMLCLLNGCNQDKNAQNLNAVGNSAAIEVIDLEGRKISLKEPPKRIIDLTGLGGTRLLMQLRESDKIVGMTSQALNTFDPRNSTYSPLQKANPKLNFDIIENVGTWNEPNIEKIMSLHPDLILIGWSGKEAADSIFQQTGVPTVCIGRMDGRFDFDNYLLLGKILHCEERAKTINAYLQGKIEMIADTVKNIPKEKRQKVFFWINPNINSMLRTNGVYDAIDFAGAINAASNSKGIGLYEVMKEQLLVWNPDYIFVQSANKRGQKETYVHSTIAEIKTDEMLGNLKAIKNGNIQYIRGPRSDWDTAIEAVEMLYIAKLVYPTEFADLNVELQGNEIFHEMYGTEGLYVDMCKNVGMYLWK